MRLTDAVRLDGAEELFRELSHLAGYGARKAVQAGMRAGLTVIRNEIRSQVPPHLKSIRRSVGSKFDLRRNIAKAGVNVGKKQKVKRKNKQTGKRELVSNKSFVPHAAVYVVGSGPRKTKKGHNRGVMPANPVVKRGYAASEDVAEQVIYSKTLERLRLEAGKTQ